MKILIAPDSFKESLSAQQAAEAISRGIRDILPDAELILLPVADGGEGTTEALVAATAGHLYTETVTGPLGDPVQATWGMLGDGRTAVVETAAASGLNLTPLSRRNPWLATSRGTGELILAALEHGVERLIIGLGGSATNDAGAGLLQALGASLLDRHGQPIGPGGSGLEHLAKLDLSTLDSRLAGVQFDVACDVDNPLLGEHGASAVFGPQKGATPAMVEQLDIHLAHFAELLQEATGRDVADCPGAGAAGGLGAALLGAFSARLQSGIDIVLDAVDIDRHLQNADLVITGEGQIDGQSSRGKTPVGVSRRAQKHKVPVIALAGSLGKGADCVHACGIDALFSIVPGIVTLETALEAADHNLASTARNVASIWKLAGKRS